VTEEYLTIAEVAARLKVKPKTGAAFVAALAWLRRRFRLPIPWTIETLGNH
jgi:hypothetical protein